jgi:hypothetical protein
MKYVDDSDGTILALAVEFFKFSPKDSDRKFIEIPFGKADVFSF